jgi:hypothetical protein
MEALGGRGDRSYSSTISALDWGEWSASRPGRAFTPGVRTPGTHWTGGWVGPKTGLDTEARGKILCPCRGSNPDRPVVQSVARHYTTLANPAPRVVCMRDIFISIEIWTQDNMYILVGILLGGNILLVHQ